MQEGKRTPGTHCMQTCKRICSPMYKNNVTTLVGVVVQCLCHRLIALTYSGLSIGEGRLRPSKANRSAEAVFMSLSVVCVHTYLRSNHYVSANDVKATEIYGSILKPCNVTAIKRMRIQCVPGALFLSLSRLGARLVGYMQYTRPFLLA